MNTGKKQDLSSQPKLVWHTDTSIDCCIWPEVHEIILINCAITRLGSPVSTSQSEVSTKCSFTTADFVWVQINSHDVLLMDGIVKMSSGWWHITLYIMTSHWVDLADGALPSTQWHHTKLIWLMVHWRIIACESSDYRHIVHDDGFVWLMFVHEHFSVSEQTLNSQNHRVHYKLVITRLTCNNSILLTRNSPDSADWQTYREDTADDTVLCISGIVLKGWRVYAYGLRAFTKETYVRLMILAW